jgi:hypothetical protein
LSLLCTIALLGVASSCMAQSEHPPAKPLADIEYRSEGKLIYVPLRVNGSDSFSLFSILALQTA